jgi:hypothetical protein
MIDPSLLSFRELAQSLRDAAADRDYAALGLILERLNSERVDVLIYIHTERLGHLSIIGRHIQLWSSSCPEALVKEPSLEEVVRVLQAVGVRQP